MDTKGVQTALRRLGFTHLSVDGDYGPRTERAVRNFQAGFAWWDLAIDGKAGPGTKKALAGSVDALRIGKGSASPHFSFSEFACKCNGRYASCERIKLDRELVRGLEDLRAAMGYGFAPISGYRCPSRNRAINGASRSQHLYGKACDVPPVLSRQTVTRLRRFTGIGFNESTGRVAHVDTRPGDVARPTTWRYGR